MHFLCRFWLALCDNIQWSASSAWLSLHWGRCTAPQELLNAGPGDASKRTLSSLGRGVHAFFAAYLVGNV